MQQQTEITFYEPYTIWYTPWWSSWWFILLSCVVGILVLYGFIRMSVRLFQRKTAKSYHVLALEQLTALQAQPVTTHEEAKQIYFSVTTLMKNYFTHRYHNDYVSCTDQEAVQQFAKDTQDEQLVEKLTQIFAGAQVIKFAGEVALQKQVNKDLEGCKSIIATTKPVEKTVNKPGGA